MQLVDLTNALISSPFSKAHLVQYLGSVLNIKACNNTFGLFVQALKIHTVIELGPTYQYVTIDGHGSWFYSVSALISLDENKQSV